MRPVIIAALTAGLTLSACQSTAPSEVDRFDCSGETASLQRGDQPPVQCRRQGPPDLPLTARGQEPGWLLELDKNQLSLQYQYGEKQFQAPAPEPQTLPSGYRYRAQNPEGETLELVLTHQYCTDAMSGMPYPFSADVTVAEQRLRGCGGNPQQLLVGREWEVENISGEDAVDSSRLSLEFTEDGKLYGHAGCNRYSGTYQLTGEGLTVSPLVSTKMACAEPLMQQESEMLKALQGVKNFELDKAGALWLCGEGGKCLKAHY